MKQACFLLLCVLLGVGPALGQDVPPPVQQQLEDIAETMEENPEDDQWLQEMEHFRRHPLPLNKAGADDLRSLRLLTDLQIQSLLHYRQALGRLVDVYELQAVPGWDAALIQRLLPFVTVRDGTTLQETLRRRLQEGEHVFLFSDSRVLEPQKGYKASSASHYLGSKDHAQFRYQYRYKNLLQWGLTGDKDAGEPFFSGAQHNGFDFYSVHLFARRLGVVKALAIGDYTVNLGQGLIQWQSLAMGKSTEAINIKRQSAVLQPYSSAGEYYFNRGAGVTLQKGRVEATVFGSYRKLSANRMTDTLSGAEVITSIQTSGYHRTPLEMEDRNHTALTVYGGSVALTYSRFRLGVNAVGDHLSKPLQKRAEPYNLFAIEGKEWSNYSLDYSATCRNVHLYGEAAVDHRFNKAFVQGVLASVAAKADVSLLYRHIAAGYQSFCGRAFTENSMPTNEQGLYMGISLRPHPRYTLHGYADFYRFPWLKYRVDAPSEGRDYSLQLTYTPHKGLELYTRYRNEQKMLNTPGTDSVVNVPLPFLRHNWRMHLSYQPSKRLELRARTELVIYDPQEGRREKGYSALVEGVYRKGGAFSGNLRLHYFSTGGYNSRIYTYESDLLYHYYIPAFFNQGVRYYLRMSWDAGKQVSFWLRWSQTYYKNIKIIGSGLDQIEGNSRSELKVQIRFIL